MNGECALDKCDPVFSLSRRRLLTAVTAGVTATAVAPGHGATAAAALPPVPTTPTTEGPYYFDPGLLRSDITEGLPGIPLEVRLRVVDGLGRALAGALTDLWHCDAAGFYSGYPGQGDDGTISTEGRTFLRGSLPADDDGLAVFRTIYPGWYEGRTTHLHFKVRNGGAALLTSQIFLPDALSEFLYTQLPAYRRTRLRDTLNSTDGIALRARSTTVGSIHEDLDRYIVSFQAVVGQDADPSSRRPPPGDGPPRRRTPRPATRLEGLIPGFKP
ncbi:MAG: intradiol ring-cleavage dioxygenase [Burkholderiales bacterium]|nr:intradiol ring-cleavage dioxygenase [Burkholderiales bacterium]